MFSFRTIATFVGVAALILLAFYVVPTALEFWLVSRGVSPVVLILLGDVLGCAAIFYIARGFGAGLYLALTAVEMSLYLTGLLTPGAQLWTTDLVPALCLIVMAFFAVGVVESSLDLN